MPSTPLASLHHRIYLLIVRVLVVMNWLLEYVELSKDTSITTLATVATVALL